MSSRSRSSSPSQFGRRNGNVTSNQGLYGGGGPNYFADLGPDSPQSLAQEIIRDYSNLFSAPIGEAQVTYQGGDDKASGVAEPTYDKRPAFMYASTETHHRPVSPASSQGRGRRARSRSPSLPEPIPAQTQFQSPTRALLHRLTDNSEQALRDSQTLRKYDRNTDFEADEPFIGHTGAPPAQMA